MCTTPYPRVLSAAGVPGSGSSRCVVGPHRRADAGDHLGLGAPLGHGGTAGGELGRDGRGRSVAHGGPPRRRPVLDRRHSKSLVSWQCSLTCEGFVWFV